MSQVTLLVPLDFSDCSGLVVERAAALAQELGGRVLLMHSNALPHGLPQAATLHPDPTRPGLPAGKLLAEEAVRLLEEHAARLEAVGIAVERLVTSGEPAEQILAVAKAREVSRIVMGTHGRTGLARLLQGSVAERVEKRAPCPVDLVQTVRQPTCSARSCAWCGTHRTQALRQVEAESEG